MIDDVAIWDRALTDGEIARIWADGSGASVGELLVDEDSDDDGMPNSFEEQFEFLDNSG